MIIGIIHELKNMGRRDLFVHRRVPILCCILMQDRISVRGHILMGIDSDERRGADVGVNNLVVEADAEALNDDVVRNGVERGEVVYGFRALLEAQG